MIHLSFPSRYFKWPLSEVTKCKRKGKEVNVLHAMKTYMGSEGITPHIFNFGTRMMSFTSRSFYSQRSSTGTDWIGDWVGPRASLDLVAKRKVFAGNECWSSSP